MIPSRHLCNLMNVHREFQNPSPELDPSWLPLLNHFYYRLECAKPQYCNEIDYLQKVGHELQSKSCGVIRAIECIFFCVILDHSQIKNTLPLECLVLCNCILEHGIH